MDMNSAGIGVGVGVGVSTCVEILIELASKTS
jgi:hypothetical protein